MVAGGSGHRFGGAKQFASLGGRPVVSWSVSACRSISDGIVLVVPKDHDGADAASGADVIVPGGSTRSDSVRAGLKAVPDGAAVILVHDAARPLAPPGLFAAALAALNESAGDGVVGIVPGEPVTDTLKRVEGQAVVSTVDRTDLVAVQTPQAFVAATLRAAYARGDDATDDAGLVEAMGGKVGIIPGDPGNIKLTNPADLAVAEELARDRSARS